jgi:4-amino-4-deoxyprephenate dehydrogenase
VSLAFLPRVPFQIGTGIVTSRQHPPTAGFGDCILVGTGSVGLLFHGLLAGHVRSVTLVDQAVPADLAADERISADVAAPLIPRLRRALAAADLVVCALPEAVLLSFLRTAVSLLRPQALLVDTASVKSGLPDAWAGARPGLSIVSLNPMFAPTLDPAGRPVIAVSAGSGSRDEALLELLRDRGMVIVTVRDPAEHDQLCATAQSAAHASVLAFGMAAVASGFSVDQILAVAPPPCFTQLMLLARMTTLAPEVYSDLQVANPAAAAARSALAAAIAEIDRLAGSGAGVTAPLAAAAGWLSGHRDELAVACQRSFQALPVIG